MKTNDSTGKGCEGSALFTILVIVVTVSALLGTMTAASLQRAYMATKLVDRANAVAIAEAGADWAYSVLASNFSHRTNPAMFPPAYYGDGSYSLAVDPVSSNLALVYSTGVCGIAVATVAVDVKNYGGWVEGDDFSDDLAFDFAVLSGGSMSWGGNGDLTTSNAAIHCNGDLSVNGGPALICDSGVTAVGEMEGNGGSWIYGDTTAPSYDKKFPAQISGTVLTEPVPPVGIPSIDFTPYAVEAANNGEYVSGDYSCSVGDISPVGGILFVDGDVRITTVGTITGCIIATGSIDILSTCDQVKNTNYPAYPALMSRDGDINIGGNGTFHGLIYSKTGDFEKSGNGLVTGTIICAGTFTKGGGWDAMIFEDSTPVPPETGDGSPTDLVGISAWKE